jgi:DNA-binding beta-propeller fold protein YncE
MEAGSTPIRTVCSPEAGSRLVVDAGANALFRVAADRTITTVAVLPSRPNRSTESVPTTVAVGPDGAYYVGEATGAPFAAGAARIYRVVEGLEPQVFLEGFKMIVDLTFGDDGTLYVLQFATGPVFFAGSGELIRVAPDGTRTTVIGGLQFPTSIYRRLRAADHAAGYWCAEWEQVLYQNCVRWPSKPTRTSSATLRKQIKGYRWRSELIGANC